MKIKKPLKLAFYIVGGLALLFALLPGIFDFVGPKDGEDAFWYAVQADRKSFFISDIWRFFIFVTLTFGTLWIFLKNKLKSKYVILIVGVLIIADMWTVNKRYLNDDHFVRKSKVERPYTQTGADQQILRDTDPNFRVFNQSVSTFNDASTSYFHKSIGGYHGAKLKRYQELIEHHIQKENSLKNKNGKKHRYFTHNIEVLSMLNAKWIIEKNGKASRIETTGYFIPEVSEDQINFINPQSGYLKYKKPCGNAWFVNEIKMVENADAEIAELNGLDVKNTAIVDTRFSEQIIEGLDNTNTSITLTEYKPNYLKYSSSSAKDGIAIFSEIYYDKGWNAYIDGELEAHFRANYVLRGMVVPKGNHSIEFKFEPSAYSTGESVSLASSIILLLLLAFVSFKELKD